MLTPKFIKICLFCTGLFVLTTLLQKGETMRNMSFKMTSVPVHILSTAKPVTLFLNRRPTLVFGENFRAYILSVLKQTELSSTTLPRKQEYVTNRPEHIVITGWIAKGNKKLSTLQIYCCFYHADNRISSVKAVIRKTHFESRRERFSALQFECPVYSVIPVIKVSLKEGRSTCTENVTHYVQVETIAKRKIDGIALCAKVIYGKFKASFIIEWFEAMRFLGVDKIFCYIHIDLNSDAKNVVKYYEDIGLANAVSFDIPENDTCTRQFGDKTYASRMDAGVTLLECLERMHNYKYVIYLDIDEILIPENMPLKNSLKRYLAEILQSSKSLALVYFKTMVHVKSWEAVIPNHPLLIGRLANSTPPMWDNQKYAFIPEGLVPGSCSSHRCLVRPGYKYKYIEENSAMIHHFRFCREEWSTGRPHTPQLVNLSEGKICSNFMRVRSYTTEMLAYQIKHNVLKVHSLLKIG